MPVFGYVLVATGALLWVAPFLAMNRDSGAVQGVDRRARWGMILQAVSYSLLWQGRFWARTPGLWWIGVSIALFLISITLCWTGARALGRQWRLDAGLNADHKLVRSGPYRLFRHPIYTSMLCLLWGTGFIMTPLPLLAASTLVFIAGTEIRVHIEDNLLESRFGDQFRDYKRAVPAYLPFH
jgi:protein-S-isoprenylcysteine O-methyltransferase Ste14